jgi:hypothetical protein
LIIKLISLSDRTLNFLSSSINAWFFKPSVGNSGGIMIGINDNLFTVLNITILDFSITIQLKNKNDSFEWYFTVVYGPTSTSRK